LSLTTPLCERIGIRVPVVQAPIGPSATPELAAAVSNAGALGTLSITWQRPNSVSDAVRRTQELTCAPFAVNVILSFDARAQVDVALDLGVPIVSTFWGDPADLHERIAAAGALHVHTVCTPDEARRAVDAGVDAVVAQGWEAGGHVAGQVATLPLVPAVVDAVDPVPVIAAGGIADGRGLAAALTLGAQAAWLGTRFVAAEEADSHDAYRSRLIAAAPEDAAHTTCFDGGWPDAAHRVLRNATLDTWEAAGRPMAPDRPGENAAVANDGDGHNLPAYSALMPLRRFGGEVDRMAMYAGQSAGLVRDVRPAADLVTAIVREAEAALANLRNG
jgi:NAD(P)H-dependent flavin oxidoreductase YrpB (nitropropane dioxygenase family)